MSEPPEGNLCEGRRPRRRPVAQRCVVQVQPADERVFRGSTTCPVCGVELYVAEGHAGQHMTIREAAFAAFAGHMQVSKHWAMFPFRWDVVALVGTAPAGGRPA